MIWRARTCCANYQYIASVLLANSSQATHRYDLTMIVDVNLEYWLLFLPKELAFTRPLLANCAGMDIFFRSAYR